MSRRAQIAKLKVFDQFVKCESKWPFINPDPMPSFSGHSFSHHSFVPFYKIDQIYSFTLKIAP